MATRAGHLNWCKGRALALVREGDVPGGWSSFASDMTKHPETADHPALELGMGMLVAGHLNSPSAMEKFIADFN